MALHYRKKPFVIEAMQLNLNNRDKIIEFGEGNITLTWRDGYLEGAYVNTLEGGIYATYGDYIIKGVDGEFYPCKPSVFEKTYELAEDIFQLMFLTVSKNRTVERFNYFLSSERGTIKMSLFCILTNNKLMSTIHLRTTVENSK